MFWFGSKFQFVGVMEIVVDVFFCNQCFDCIDGSVQCMIECDGVFFVKFGFGVEIVVGKFVVQVFVIVVGGVEVDVFCFQYDDFCFCFCQLLCCCEVGKVFVDDGNIIVIVDWILCCIGKCWCGVMLIGDEFYCICFLVKDL